MGSNGGEPRLHELAARAGLGEAVIYLSSVDRVDKVIAVDAGATIYPASMIKTPLAVAAAAAVAAGRIAWSDQVIVEAANITPTDAPSPLATGVAASIGELVELMLGRSDNIATNVLIDRLGRSRATTDIAALGFPDTVFRRKLSGALPLIDDPEATGRNVHPARDACELFRRIARAQLPGAAFIEGILATQYWNAKLSAGLAPGDRFAHKTGDTDEVSHDGGILTLASGQRYVLVVYTQLESNDATDRRFADFMCALREQLPLR
jgi:beta-lactamase class A